MIHFYFKKQIYLVADFSRHSIKSVCRFCDSIDNIFILEQIIQNNQRAFNHVNKNLIEIFLKYLYILTTNVGKLYVVNSFWANNRCNILPKYIY